MKRRKTVSVTPAMGASTIAAAVATVLTSTTETILHAGSFFLAFLVMTFFHVVVGEVVPKNLAIEKADRLAQAIQQRWRVNELVMYEAGTVISTHAGTIWGVAFYPED